MVLDAMSRRTCFEGCSLLTGPCCWSARGLNPKAEGFQGPARHQTHPTCRTQRPRRESAEGRLFVISLPPGHSAYHRAALSAHALRVTGGCWRRTSQDLVRQTQAPARPYSESRCKSGRGCCGPHPSRAQSARRVAFGTAAFRFSKRADSGVPLAQRVEPYAARFQYSRPRRRREHPSAVRALQLTQRNRQAQLRFRAASPVSSPQTGSP